MTWIGFIGKQLQGGAWKILISGAARLGIVERGIAMNV
jgi:hypothetical protein